MSSNGETAGSDRLSAPEAIRALEIASAYLDDVETVVWTTALRTEDADLEESLLELSEELWGVQNEFDETIAEARSDVTVPEGELEEFAWDAP